VICEQGITFWNFFIKLLQTKRLFNSKGIRWNEPKSEAKNSSDGLKASVSFSCDGLRMWTLYPSGYQYVVANEGFVISEAYSGMDNFPGTIVYYFEVTRIATNINNSKMQ
jgi:hypothetical protein